MFDETHEFSALLAHLESEFGFAPQAGQARLDAVKAFIAAKAQERNKAEEAAAALREQERARVAGLNAAAMSTALQMGAKSTAQLEEMFAAAKQLLTQGLNDPPEPAA